MHKFVPLTVEKDHARVLDLCHRAADYIRLETGKDPDADYVTETLTEAPPQLSPDDVFLTGVERSDGRLAGLVTYLRHFYKGDEWYMGLMLLDPAERGKKLGQQTAEHVFNVAKAKQGTLIRIAVLELNPRGRKFWEARGFLQERTVPAENSADGHARQVLQKRL